MKPKLTRASRLSLSLSLCVIAAAASIFLLSVAKIILTPGANIYNLFSSSRNVYVLCILFISFFLINKGREILTFDKLSIGCSIILSFLVVISTLYDYLTTNNKLFELSPYHVFSARPAYYIFLFFVLLIFFYFLLLSSRAAWFSVPINSPAERKPSLVRVLGFLIIYTAIFILLYLPCAPYMSSGDTINQWQQIHGELPYNRIHAIGHTILLKIILSIYDSYTAVIIFHIIAVIIIYLVFSEYFSAKGFSFSFIAFIFCMGLFISCRYAKAYFYPWKDTVSAVCLSIVCYFIMKYTDNCKLSIKGALVLGISLAGCMIFRLNGIVAFTVCGLYFSISFLRRKNYRQLVAMLMSIVLSYSLVNVYAERVLHPEKYENGFSIQVFASGIAAMVKSGELSQEELEEIDHLISVEWMQENYQSTVYKLPIIWYPDGSEEIAEDSSLQVFNNKFVLDLGRNKWDVVALYFKLMPRHFMVCVRDVLGSLRMMWGTSPVFVYSYAFCALLLLYLSIKARLRPKDCAIFLPSVCNTISIMISTITNEERYLLPSFMLMPVYFLYILYKNKEHRKNEFS